MPTYMFILYYIIISIILIGGIPWYTYPSEKYEFVSWDDYFPYMETKFMFQTK